MRERIGDRAGAAATRQNLRVICGPTPLIYRLSHVCLWVLAFVCALVVGAAGVAGAAFLADGDGTAQLTVGVRGDGVVVSDDGAIRCAQASATSRSRARASCSCAPNPTAAGSSCAGAAGALAVAHVG